MDVQNISNTNDNLVNSDNSLELVPPSADDQKLFAQNYERRFQQESHDDQPANSESADEFSDFTAQNTKMCTNRQCSVTFRESTQNFSQPEAPLQKHGGKSSAMEQEQGPVQLKNESQSEDIEQPMHSQRLKEAGHEGQKLAERDKEHGTSSGHKENTQTLPSASSLLDSLFAKQMLQGSPVEATEAAQPLPSQEMNALVERILVSEPVHGAQEVRISLAQGALQGSELSIVRTLEGQLHIEIVCQDTSAFHTAVEARQNLVDALKVHGEDVDVVISKGNADGGNEGEMRHRSKGLQLLADNGDGK